MFYIGEDKIAKLSLENEIVHLVFKTDTIVNLERAKELVSERIALCKGKEYPLFIDIRGILDVDTAAREYLKGEEALSYASAAALLIESPLSKFLANLVITIDRPGKPIKSFTKEAKALAWLKKHRKEQQI